MACEQARTSDRKPQLHRWNTVFFHSDIGKAQRLSPHGARVVMCKRTMTTPDGGIETDVQIYVWDWAVIGGRELLQTRFTFKSGRGAAIDTTKLSMLFSLVDHDPEV